MAPLVLECPNAGCVLGVNGQRYKTPDMEAELALRMLDLHVQQNHSELQGVGETGPKAQKLQRPSIPEDCSEVQWAFFVEKWEDYKRFYRLTTKDEIYSHMRS